MPFTTYPSITPHISSSRVWPVSRKSLRPCITFHIFKPHLSCLRCKSTFIVLNTSSSSVLCTTEPCAIAGVVVFFPFFLVNVYQYCISHHDGATKSDTENALLMARNRSIGVLISSAEGSVGTVSDSAGKTSSGFGARSLSLSFQLLTARWGVSQTKTICID